MSVDNFLNKISKKQKLVLVQGKTPFLLATNLDKEKVSDEIFSRKEIFSFMSYVGINSSSLKGVNYFYSNGKKYQVNSLMLSDLLHLEISLADTELFNFSDLVLPGYVFDWAQSAKGLILFYGSDINAVHKFGLSFTKFRAENLKGSSLIFSDSDLSFVGQEEHNLVFSTMQSEYLESKKGMKLFDHISFTNEFESIHTDKIMSDIDQRVLISAPIQWSDVASTWGSLKEKFDNSKKMNFLANNLIGFIGIKSVENQTGQKEYLFEAVPFSNSSTKDFLDLNYDQQVEEILKMKETNGYSFNQSIQSLLMKRRIVLENAYEASPDPKELNNMLTQVGF